MKLYAIKLYTFDPKIISFDREKNSGFYHKGPFPLLQYKKGYLCFPKNLVHL